MKLYTLRSTWLDGKRTSSNRFQREVCLIGFASSSSSCKEGGYAAMFVLESRWRIIRSEIPWIRIFNDEWHRFFGDEPEHVNEEPGPVGQQSRRSQSSVLLLRAIHNCVPSKEHVMAIRKRIARDSRARFQMEIRRHELDEMELLCKAGNLSSKKELLNTALTLLKWAVRESQRGFSIASVDEDGQIRSEPFIQYLETVGKGRKRGLTVIHPQPSGGGSEDETEDAALEPERGKISAALG